MGDKLDLEAPDICSLLGTAVLDKFALGRAGRRE
jgi:hypothetical protein